MNWEEEVQSLPTYKGTFKKGDSPWDREMKRRREIYELQVSALLSLGINPHPPKVRKFSRKKKAQ